MASCGTHRQCQSGDHNLAACGQHYKCADGYTDAAHATCTCGQSYVCQSGHSDCSSSSGGEVSGETVAVVFEVYDKQYSWGSDYLKDTVTVNIPLNATVTWSIEIKGCGSTSQLSNACELFGGWTFVTSMSSLGDATTVVINFTASRAGTVRYYMEYNSQAWTPTQSVSYASAATLSLRSTTRSSTTIPVRLTSTSRASEVVDTTGATDMGTYVLNAENGWEYIFYELPRYSTDGKYAYEYFVQEITEGYDVSYTNNAGINEGAIIITNNKHVPTTTDVRVNKTWVDESGNAYMLTKETIRYFKLFNGTEDITTSATSIDGATLAGEYILLTTPLLKYQASFTVKNLPIGGSYSVKEYVLVDGTYTEVADYVSQTNGYIIDVTNKLTDVTVNKTWAPMSDSSSTYSRPAVTFELWRTYAGGAHEMVESKVLNSGATSLTWDMLPLTVDGTTPYTYYVKEQLPAGFIAGNEGSVDVAHGGSGTITNTPTELKVEKAWTMLNGTAITPADDTVIYYKLMRQKVTISGDTETMVGDAEAYSSTVFTLTGAASWKATHALLPLYWTDSTTGNSGEYRYYVVETDANGSEIYAQYSTTSVDVSTLQTITITNTQTAITVRKVWSVNGGSLPETLPEIELQLRYTHTMGVKDSSDPVVDTVKLTADTPGVTVTRDNAGNVFWTYKWDELATHDIVVGEAKARYYYVVETAEPEFFRYVTDGDVNNLGITGAINDQIIEIKNELITYELPETGGAGTTPYTVCGLLMLASALAALMYIEVARKKQWGEGRES